MLEKKATCIFAFLAVASMTLAAGPASGPNENSATDAGTVTFYEHVLPVLQENCQECHRPEGANYGGMRAPMAFMSYDDTRPWAKSIARQVASREMPPWDAALEHKGTFANERVLEDEEIDLITRWAESGAKQGDQSKAPPAKEFKTAGGWLIGEPDLVVTMPEPYTVSDDTEDIYTAFSVDLTEEMMPEDRWVTAFQCKPDSSVIHHFNLHVLEPDENGKLPDELPEFPKNGQIAPQQAGNYMGGTSSGSEANRYPEGFGFLLKKGSRITFDIHYHKEPGPGTAVADQSSIGFIFSEEPLERSLGSGISPLMKFDFAIPANTTDYQVGPLSTVARKDTDLIGLMPHMHLRGQKAKFEAFYPDGTSEVLLWVPKYDFSWQTVYYYKEMKRLPKGTRVEYTAWFDNSAENGARAGFDSNREVRFGPTLDRRDGHGLRHGCCRTRLRDRELTWRLPTTSSASNTRSKTGGRESASTVPKSATPSAFSCSRRCTTRSGKPTSTAGCTRLSSRATVAASRPVTT